MAGLAACSGATGSTVGGGSGAPVAGAGKTTWALSVAGASIVKPMAATPAERRIERWTDRRR